MTSTSKKQLLRYIYIQEDQPHKREGSIPWIIPLYHKLNKHTKSSPKFVIYLKAENVYYLCTLSEVILTKLAQKAGSHARK